MPVCVMGEGGGGEGGGKGIEAMSEASQNENNLYLTKTRDQETRIGLNLKQTHQTLWQTWLHVLWWLSKEDTNELACGLE